MITILEPKEKQSALLISVPHAGEEIPTEALPSFTNSDIFFLTTDSDLHVDKLYALAPNFGATVIITSTGRYVIDVNRDCNTVDSSFLQGAVAVKNPYPLGLIAHKTMSGMVLIKRPLTRTELNTRIEKYYAPFHAALQQGIAQRVKKFGFCLHIDAHSMPSVGTLGHLDCGKPRPDVDLGDCNGKSCSEKFVATIESVFKKSGLNTKRNDPYQGAFIEQHYGNPQKNVHTILIEFNRALYMDEKTHAPIAEKFSPLQKIVCSLLREVSPLIP